MEDNLFSHFLVVLLDVLQVEVLIGQTPPWSRSKHKQSKDSLCSFISYDLLACCFGGLHSNNVFSPHRKGHKEIKGVHCTGLRETFFFRFFTNLVIDHKFIAMHQRWLEMMTGDGF